MSQICTRALAKLRRMERESADVLTTLAGVVAAVSDGFVRAGIYPEFFRTAGEVSLLLLGYFANKRVR